MSDLVKRLREYAGDSVFANERAMREAADRIEELEAELKAIAEACNASGGEFWYPMDKMDYDYKILPTMLNLEETK